MSQNDTLPTLNGLPKHRENTKAPIDNQVVTNRATFGPADTKSKELPIGQGIAQAIRDREAQGPTPLYTTQDKIRAMADKNPAVWTLIKALALREDF